MRHPRRCPPGTLVRLEAASGKALGVATFNPHTLVAARILDRDSGRVIGREFFAERLEAALALRRRLYPEPFYRLVHAEADGLPGLVIDRFGDVLACQLNTAGMARLEAELIAACETVLKPEAVIFRNDSFGAQARRPGRGSAGGCGRIGRAGRVARERRALLRRCAGGPEDRLVLRSAREPAFHRILGEGRVAARSLLFRRRFCRRGGAGRRQGGLGHRPVGTGAGARPKLGRGQRRRLALHIFARRGLRRIGAPGGRAGALRHRRRRSARFRQKQEGPWRGPQGLSQARAARPRRSWPGTASCSSPPVRTMWTRRLLPRRCGAAWPMPAGAGAFS